MTVTQLIVRDLVTKNVSKAETKPSECERNLVPHGSLPPEARRHASPPAPEGWSRRLPCRRGARSGQFTLGFGALRGRGNVDVLLGPFDYLPGLMVPHSPPGNRLPRQPPLAGFFVEQWLSGRLNQIPAVAIMVFEDSNFAVGLGSR